MSAPRPPAPLAPAPPKLAVPSTPTKPTTPSAPLNQSQTPKENPPTPLAKMPTTPNFSSLAPPGVETGIQSSSYEQALLWAHQHSAAMYSNVPQVVSGPPPKEPVRPKGAKLTSEEISLVQGLIERCLQLYMSQNEVISALHQQANIEPGFTSLVWQKLEEQNPQFFKCYALRMKLKEQITAFNYLVGQQAQLMARPAAQQHLAAGTGGRPGVPSAAALAAQQKKPIGIGTVSFAPLSNPLKSFAMPPSASPLTLASTPTPAAAAAAAVATAVPTPATNLKPPATIAPSPSSSPPPPFPSAAVPAANPFSLSNHDFLGVSPDHDKDSKDRQHATDTFDVSQFFDDGS